MKPDKRQFLLRTGMGCFAFAALSALINILVFPYARDYHGYSALPVYASFAAALFLFVFAGRKLRTAQDAQLLRIRRIAVPFYLIVLFLLHILLGYLMEYVPAGDNFMLYNGSRTLARDGDFHTYPDFGLYLARFSNQWGFLMMLTGFWKLLAMIGIESYFMPLVIVQALLYTMGVLCALLISSPRTPPKWRMMSSAQSTHMV